MNVQQKLVRAAALLLIGAAFIHCAYQEWAIITKQSVGNSVTDAAVVAWAINSVSSTVGLVLLSPVGIGGVLLLGYLYCALGTRPDDSACAPPRDAL